MRDTNFRHRRPEPWFDDTEPHRPVVVRDWSKWWHPVVVLLLPAIVGVGGILYMAKFHSSPAKVERPENRPAR
jgi:hypothetical protein